LGELELSAELVLEKEEEERMVVVNMEMPTKCSQCGFCINQKTNDYGSFGECSLQDRKTVDCLVWSRDSDCPLTEIVTCKDCIHRDPEDKFCDCGHMIKWSSPREDNWYCKDAERKE
jgi:hypothetical protein